MKSKLLPFFLFSILSFHVNAQSPAKAIPAFKFFQLNGTAFTNQNLAPGKFLFFVFYDVTCDHCQRAIQQINQQHKELNKAAIYLISLDSKKNTTAFMEKYGFNLLKSKNVMLLQDLQNQFIERFGPRKYPSIFLYSSAGRLILYDDNQDNIPRFIKKLR